LLAEQLFGDVSLRAPGDIDILIRPRDTYVVREELEARGYVDVGRGRRAAPLTDV
jgi:hypothetical protein